MSVPPSDPTLYRFFEIIQVFGYPLKAIIHEKVDIYLKIDCICGTDESFTRVVR